jgi:hypothetical protein
MIYNKVQAQFRIRIRIRIHNLEFQIRNRIRIHNLEIRIRILQKSFESSQIRIHNTD